MPPEQSTSHFSMFLEIEYPRNYCGIFYISFAHRSTATIQTTVVTPVGVRL